MENLETVENAHGTLAPEAVPADTPVVADAAAPKPTKAKRGPMSEEHKEKLRQAAAARKAAGAGGAAPKTPKASAPSGPTLEQQIAKLLLKHGRDAVVQALDKLVAKLTGLAG